ncbi:hypothetical protein D3C72_2197000 [compost metagenome]
MQGPQTLNARAEYRGFVASLQQQGLQCAMSGHADHGVNATFRERTESPLPAGVLSSQTDLIADIPLKA